MGKQAQTQERKVRALEQVENEIEALLDGISDHEGEEDLVYQQVIAALCRAERTAWIARRFPVFDLGCLSRMKRQKLLLGGHGLDLWVPTLVASWYVRGSVNTVDWIPTEDLYRYGYSSSPFPYFDGRFLQQNRELLYNSGLGNTQLSAQAPTVPLDVRRRVSKLEGKFDGFRLVWEAEWEPIPVGDPLVLGVIGDLHFLVDQFDLTKLERYISGEYCRKVE